jgi:hypothetical protein
MEIKTIEELEKHIGEYLAFETTQYFRDHRIVWIQKLHSISKMYCSTKQLKGARISEVDGLKTYGLYTAEVYPRRKVYTTQPKEPYGTNAQQIIRTPTKEEMKIFQDMWRRYRMLGDTAILNTRTGYIIKPISHT